MDNIKYYKYNSAQDIASYQLLFSLYKNIINVTTSYTWEESIDYDLLVKAFDKVVERNDCLRLAFTKKKGKRLQWVRESVHYDIKRVTFNTQQEEDTFFETIAKKAVPWKKNICLELFFAKTANGHDMLIMKACHLNLDTYGSVFIYKDLNAVYKALKDGTEMPPMPAQFTTLLEKDIKAKFNKERFDLESEYFIKYLKSQPVPAYSNLGGNDFPEKKYFYDKARTIIKLPFFVNKTHGGMLPISKELTHTVLEYCSKNKISPNDFFFHICNITLYKMNNTPNMIQYGLSNCRATMNERNCGGDKAQSYCPYVSLDPEKSFKETLEFWSLCQTEQMKHIGYDDVKFQSLMHKVWDYPLPSCYSGFMFSMVPSISSGEFGVRLHSNGRFPLPVYLAVMLDFETEDLKFAYEVQEHLASMERINRFHSYVVQILEQVTKNPDIKLADIKLK